MPDDTPPATACHREDYCLIGSFWTANMLAEERRHRDIRDMAANQKHILGSIAANYEMSLQIQMEWRLEQGVDWAVSAEGRSTFAGAVPLNEPLKKLTPGMPHLDHWSYVTTTCRTSFCMCMSAVHYLLITGTISKYTPSRPLVVLHAHWSQFNHSSYSTTTGRTSYAYTRSTLSLGIPHLDQWSYVTTIGRISHSIYTLYIV